jgi:hypothetical protein
MRKFKFRIWDGKEYSYFDLFNVEGFIAKDIQQFTGLKDKNRKGIYEGDIVKFIWLYEKTGVIRWIHGYFAVVWEDEDYYLWDVDVEVVGNIYENPELLEAGK